jgi:hypothetical protein
MESTTLFRSEDLIVRHHRLGSAQLFVCFSSYTETPTVDRAGFGENYFINKNIDAIHVITRNNLWYQYPEWQQALSVIQTVASGYNRVVAYGSSMGGYAALRFGGTCGAHAGIAISPQFSIDPAIAPFEHRWRERTLIDFRGEEVDSLQERYIIYDPRDDDRKHYDLFAATGSVIGIKVPYAGHPAGAYLEETKMLSPIVMAVGDRTLDAKGAERMLRQRRRDSASYLSTVASTLRAHHSSWKISYARRAVEISPNGLFYKCILAQALAQAGEYEEADAILRPFIGHSGSDFFPVHFLVSSLVQQHRFSEALLYLLAHRPRHPGIHQLELQQDIVLQQAAQAGEQLCELDAFAYCPRSASPLTTLPLGTEPVPAGYLFHTSYELVSNASIRVTGLIDGLREWTGGFQLTVHQLTPAGEVTPISHRDIDFQDIASQDGIFDFQFNTPAGTDTYAVFAILNPSSNAIADHVFLCASIETVATPPEEPTSISTESSHDDNMEKRGSLTELVSQIRHRLRAR